MKISSLKKESYFSSFRNIDIELTPETLDQIMDQCYSSVFNTSTSDEDYWTSFRTNLGSLILSKEENMRFCSKIDFTKSNAYFRRMDEFVRLLDDIIKDIKHGDCIMDKLNIRVRESIESQFTGGGHNADWSCAAWYVGYTGTSEEEDGSCYIIDNENGTYSITQRNYVDDDFQDIQLITIDLNQAKDAQQGYDMIDLLVQSATYIKHNS